MNLASPTSSPTALDTSRLRARAPWAERLVLGRLEGLQSGVLEVELRGTTQHFGTPADDGLRARVRVRDPAIFGRVLLSGALGAAEAYLEGGWEADDLTSVARIFARNAETMNLFEGGAARIGGWLAALVALARRNTRNGSRRNIAEHYDLGNDFFEWMLDPTLTYSSAIYAEPDASLEAGSRHKLDLLCRAVNLGPKDHLVEIGCGWGSLALHAAQHFGCRVTTTTISREQFMLATARVQAAGLADRITVLNSDYRDLPGRYDKLLSCEMIEAVGSQYYETFFRRCSELLVPGGQAALQAITIRDQRYAAAAREVDFIKRYVFPGSCIPSVKALLDAATAASDFTLQSLADYTPHYARTLAHWRENLLPHREQVVERFGGRFWRLWMYYLAYCEAGFAERHIGLMHLVLARPD